MQGQQRSLLIILILLALLIAFGSAAAPYTPSAPSQIVAKWDKAASEKNQHLNLQQR